jgi:hypothetical protein
MIEAALAYAERGWCIVPMRSSKRFYFTGGVRVATRDPAMIAQWSWAERIGMACGQPSGTDVLDVDDSTGFPFDLEALLGTTLAAKTPNGYHLFWKYAGGLRSRAFKWGEYRSTGLAVVLPSGSADRYWLNELEPQIAPAALLQLLIEPREPIPQHPLGHQPSFGPHLGGQTLWLPSALYHKVNRLVPRSDRVTAHHQRRVCGILNIALQRDCHRNDALNIAGFCLRELVRDGIVSPAAAEELLFDVATLNGYVRKDGHAAARATIRSGLGLSGEGQGNVDG